MLVSRTNQEVVVMLLFSRSACQCVSVHVNGS